jgi:hypothetical protein
MIGLALSLLAALEGAYRIERSKTKSAFDKDSIGVGLRDLFLAGRNLRYQMILDQTNSFKYWNEKYLAWANEVYAFVGRSISEGKAVYIVSADNHAAVFIPDMKGVDKQAKTGLVQRIDAILERLTATAGEY